MAQPSQHEIKQELVDAIRMLEHAEYIDHNGHCSVRRDANSFYINSGASMRLALFDLDNTLLAGDSDYEWGQFLVDRGVLDRETYEAQNKTYYDQYVAGTLFRLQDFRIGVQRRF